METAAACIGNYRSRGYRIAANYTGPRSDWMVELDSLYPDVVRISASNLLHHEARDLDEHRAQLQRQRAGAGIWFAEQRREIHNTSASPPAAAAPVSAAAPQSAAISG